MAQIPKAEPVRGARLRRAWPVALMGLLAVGAPVAARSKVYVLWVARYQPRAGGALATTRCMVCHVTSDDYSKLNAYGADIKRGWARTRSNTALAAIERLDSDRDGFSNIAEIKADTLPGDPRSKAN